MTHSLYAKFILGYLVFGLIGFVFIATFPPISPTAT